MSRGVVERCFVEQGYASLMIGSGVCGADCWRSRLVVVGSPWRVSLRQSQLSDVLQRTRVQWELFDYSNRARTVSNPKTGACYRHVSIPGNAWKDAIWRGEKITNERQEISR